MGVNLTLTGNAIKDTYKGLLKFDDNNSLGATFKTVTDGFGNPSALKISSSSVKAVKLYSQMTASDIASDSDGSVVITRNYFENYEGNLNFKDNAILSFGDSDDLLIYHDGSNSYINQAGVGSLILGGTVTATTPSNSSNDSTLATTAFVNNMIGQVPAGLAFEGSWDASTNSPDLTSINPSNGQFWIVSNEGTTDLDGITDWSSGDWAVYVEDGAGSDSWQKIDNSSVLNGQGTSNYISKWSGLGTSVTLGDSIIYDDGTNVGIGTTVPNQKIGVNGNINIAGGDGCFLTFNNGDAAIEVRDNGDGRDLLFRTYGGSGIGNLERMRITKDGNVKLGDSNKLLLGAGEDLQILHDGNNSYIAETGTGGLFIDSSKTTFQINGSSAMTVNFDSNVGIGTSNPSEKLEVDGVIKAVHTDSTYAKLRGTGLYFNRSTVYIAPEGDNVTSLNVGLDGQRFSQLKLNADTFTVSRAAVEFMRVSSSGNVGIGTDAPSTKLEVVSAANEEGISIVDSSSNVKYKVRQFSGYAYSSFYNASNTEQVRINSNGTSWFNGGNVGIGTDAPSAKLEVDGNIKALGDVIFSDGASSAGINDDDQLSIFGDGGLLLESSDGISITISDVLEFKATGFSFGNGDLANISSTNITQNRSYTLPDADGVIALTSDIPSLSGLVDGSGTANKISKWSDSDTLTDSILEDDGSTLTVYGGIQNKFPFVASLDCDASGQNSLALGLTTTASEVCAVAFGRGTTASGANSLNGGDGGSSTGNNSIGFGYYARAHGDSSACFGKQNWADGDFSTALGQATEATGDWSTSMGEYTRAKGEHTVAMGYQSTAETPISLSMGTWNSSNQTSDNTAFVIGNGVDNANRSDAFRVDTSGNVTASGDIEADALTATNQLTAANISIGSSNTVTNSGNAIGNFATSSNPNSLALGLYVKATGNGSAAFGFGSEATGEGSFAVGGGGSFSYDTSASGNYSFAQGRDSTASADDSVAFSEGTASGSKSFAVGSTASGGSAFAFRGLASGDRSIAFFGEAATDNSMTVGRYNTSNQTSDNTAFVIGNGANVNDRSDAFRVDTSGNTTLGGALILSSPNGTKYEITVDNSGNLTTTAV